MPKRQDYKSLAWGRPVVGNHRIGRNVGEVNFLIGEANLFHLLRYADDIIGIYGGTGGVLDGDDIGVGQLDSVSQFGRYPGASAAACCGRIHKEFDGCESFISDQRI